RRAELVPHLRDEARLQLLRASLVLGPLLELGVEGHHAAVRVFELLAQLGDQIFALDELALATTELLGHVRGTNGRRRCRLPRRRLGRAPRTRQALEQPHDRAAVELDGEIVHEPPCPEHAEPHARGGAVGPGEHGRVVVESRTPIANLDDQTRGRLVVDVPRDLASPAVHDRVPAELRDGGGDAGDLEPREAERLRERAAVPLRRDDVRVDAEGTTMPELTHGAYTRRWLHRRVGDESRATAPPRRRRRSGARAGRRGSRSTAATARRNARPPT